VDGAVKGGVVEVGHVLFCDGLGMLRGELGMRAL